MINSAAAKNIYRRQKGELRKEKVEVMEIRGGRKEQYLPILIM